jgi:hypothetical protein
LGKHEKPARIVDNKKGKHESVREPAKGSGVSKHGKDNHNVTDKKGQEVTYYEASLTVTEIKPAALLANPTRVTVINVSMSDGDLTNLLECVMDHLALAKDHENERVKKMTTLREKSDAE